MLDFVRHMAYNNTRREEEIPTINKPGENINGALLISFDGIEYPLADVLTSRHNKPALLIPGPGMYHGYVALETI